MPLLPDDPSLAVHLLAGLPTEAVRRGFARAGAVMPVVPLDRLADAAFPDAARIGVLLPPFVEPSLVVESWEECDFLPYHFGRPAHIAAVSTFVDVEQIAHHLASTSPLSARGWGRGDQDARTIADIAVEQIESATHLALVGGAPASEPLARRLGVLNPGASRVSCRAGANLDRVALAAALGVEETGNRPARPMRVVPPWLEVLRGDVEPVPRPDLFVYRRTRPFDATRLHAWLANPPGELLRGKGHVWLADEPDCSFGYSCAGSVHRLFPSGRWWASQSDGAWPRCSAQRRRLLERWHPRFGDRRQELVFLGVDLDPEGLSAGLDRCLSEGRVDSAAYASRAECGRARSTQGVRLH